MRVSYFCLFTMILFFCNPLTCKAQDRKAQTMPEEVSAVVYLCEEYPVQTKASLDSDVAAWVPSGQTVEIRGMEYNEEEGIFWVFVSFFMDSVEGAERIGYIERWNLACADERFLQWEAEYFEEMAEAQGVEGAETPGMERTERSDAEGVETLGTERTEMSATDYAAKWGWSAQEEPSFTFYGEKVAGTTVSADIAQFPESYRAALIELKQKHPKWIFAAMETGLDWEQVIAGEIGGGRSLVYKTLPDCTKEGLYDDGMWYYASEDILKYYMDPRNGLTEDGIFQFEQLTYNESYHTEQSVESFLANTFMRSPGIAPGTDQTYAHIFWRVGSDNARRISPFHLAARVYQEQGQGTSQLISGRYPGYEGYYNYFNVGATGQSTREVIESGLKYAKDHGWNNAYNAISGGANVISASYIKKGQDTLYLQKYNVNRNGTYALYTHQYMQNISAPASEAKSMKKLYASAGALDNTFVFKIPVYRNMPEETCAYPVASTNVVLQIPAGYDATLWVDGLPCAPATRNGRQIITVPNASAKGAVVYRYNAAGVPTGMYVWTLEYQNGAYRATPQPKLQDLLSYHGFSIRITGKSGIRFKTGISESLKAELQNTGIDGYRLKEYGTLVMNNANRAAYPMVKGGEKVLCGMAYGVDAQGQKQDLVYETVGGRQRYTSVLIGLPADQYRTEFAFRGYIVLEKDGAEVTLYGPVVAKSICALAEQVLDMGTYPAGSDADTFLRKIVAGAYE